MYDNKCFRSQFICSVCNVSENKCKAGAGNILDLISEKEDKSSQF